LSNSVNRDVRKAVEKHMRSLLAGDSPGTLTITSAPCPHCGKDNMRSDNSPFRCSKCKKMIDPEKER